MYYILRNNQQFGPYDYNLISSYVNDGKILKRDIAFMQNNTADIRTAGYFLKKKGINTKIGHKGNILQQLKSIGRELILPKSVFQVKDWFKDKRLISLAAIGLGPAFLISFTLFSYFTFYAIALYFSIIWGLFFYYLFNTKQVKWQTSVLVFFLVQIAVLVFINLQNFPGFSFFYSLINSDYLLIRMIGFIFGVGILEEIIKALPLFFIVQKAKEPLIPQTLVYYGLISGIGFGVYEGVLYQTTVNVELGYNESFFMNVARLTCLPFLHAIWSGIAGYFISFADLYPKYRKSLYLLAILVPALLHGLYDTFGWSIVGLFITVIGVVLLINYLKQGINYQSKHTK